MPGDLFVHGIGTLVTPLSIDRDQSARPLHVVHKAAIMIEKGRIAAAGKESEIVPSVRPGMDRLDAKGVLALPGLVDCHTHPVYVGNRADEFHLRNAGKSYLDIAAAGGGIQATARKVRAASVEQIVRESLPRFRRLLMSGVTTCEAKSGYGLDWFGEEKLLNALREIESKIPQRMHRTFLVHALPEAFAEKRDVFCNEVIHEMIPEVASRKLAATVDIFCELGAFTVNESRRILQSALDHHLRIAVHANQFGHTGGALLAAELKAQSAHHLEFLNDEEIDALASAETVGVALPASVFFLGNLPYPPVRRMIERGLRVAVATDLNPGSAMTTSLPFCLTTAAIYCHMNPSELLWSVTLDGAKVLGMDDDVGSLEVGKMGDVTLWDIPDLESLSYHFGDFRPAQVIIGGELCWSDGDATPRV